MRAVLDTNIFLSGLIFPQGSPGQVLTLARQKKFAVFSSSFILNEIKKNLMVKFGYDEKETDFFLLEILKFVTLVRSKIKVEKIKVKDDDNRILECALEAKADFLVTGDRKHILPLRNFRGIKILPAQDFLKLI